jgi:phosphoribosylamine--glycine ligase
VRILVLGSGAREHAIVTALLAEQAGHTIVAAPGNAGIAAEVETVAIDASDPRLVAGYAADNAFDLVVIGPEAPLVAGVADAIRRRRIPVFGPDKAAAALEGSKTFAKRIMDVAGVPTGRSTHAATIDAVASALDEFGAPHVVKADGLAAGKGVIVTDDRDAALAHAEYYLQHGEVLIEEFLGGPEVSLFFLADGHDVLPLSPAQDYKRVGDGDAGPNTGGMGAYSPLPWLAKGLGDTAGFGSEAAFVDEVRRTIALPTVRALEAEGTPFVGLLYCGLALTSRGLRVVEFNARFGDPETQVVLARLRGSLAELLHASATGRLEMAPPPRWRSDAAVTVVLAAAGYPRKVRSGDAIRGIDDAESEPGVHVLHAGTATAADGALLTAGGRVLSVVGVGESVAAAREVAYRGVAAITLDGAQHRGDIAAGI